MKQIGKILKNKIWIIAAAVLLMLSLQGCGGIISTSLALEQSVRCGMEEHIHSGECYIDEVLVCDQKMHSHSENCYLVLLEDNDINLLLSIIDSSEAKSLEAVIGSALNDAVNLNTLVSQSGNSTAWESADDGGVATNDDIVMLNRAISDGVLNADVVMNESLDTVYSSSEGMSGAEALAQLAAVGGNGAISTLGLGDEQASSGSYINFYIYIAGEGWTYIGNLPYSVYDNRRAVQTTELEAFVSEGAGLSDGYRIYHASSSTANRNNWSETGTRSNGTYTTFGNYNNNYYDPGVRYARIIGDGDNTYDFNNPSLKFYRISYEYQDGTVKYRYVQTGGGSVRLLSDLPDGYVWQNGETSYPGGSSVTISGHTTFTAVPDEYTVTYLRADGSIYQSFDNYKPGDIHTIIAEISGHYWTDGDGNTVGSGSTVAVDTDLVYRAVPQTSTLTYLNEDGTLYEQFTLDYTEQHIILTELAGCVWYDEDAGGVVSSGTVMNHIIRDYAFKAVRSFSVSYDYISGEDTVISVVPGDSITLPALSGGNVWVDQNGRIYSGGEVLTPAGSMSLAEKSTMTVSYDVEFPTGNTDYYGTPAYPASPTIVGTDNATTTSDILVEGGTVEIRDVSDRMPTVVANHGADFAYPIYFEGWETETGAVIRPAANIGWDEMAQYDEDGDGNIELTGVWADSMENTVNFCIHLESRIVVGGGTASDYTPSLFATYLGGAVDTGFSLPTAESEEAYLNADIAIRNMYSDKGGDMWFHSFPSDDYIFAQLKASVNAGTELTVEGESVRVEDLNSENYTIRWTTMFYRGDDGWHIDGRLVRKLGQITVTKAFGGDEAAIAAAEDSFYITATNGTLDESGNFRAMTGADARTERLTLDSAVLENGVYTWKISDVKLGEYWQVVEYPSYVTVEENGKETTYTCYAEYSVYDTDGNRTAIAEYGTQAIAMGKTFAFDEDPNQGLHIEFKNYYYPSDSILIKKEDMDTGQPLGGAVFELWQYVGLGEPGANATGYVRLSFRNEDGVLVRDDNGSISQLATQTDGFSVISTSGFSYTAGNIIIREVTAPAGYDLAPYVLLSQNEGEDVKIGMLYYIDDNGEVKPLETSEYGDYAEVPNNSVVVIKDRSTYYTSVTVKKIWDSSKQETSVDVVLQANGKNAASVFPGFENAQIVLTESDDPARNWTHTWENLPAYANGELVEWSVKEVKVGGDTTLADGISFANWIPVYSAPTGTDDDRDGIYDNWAFTVTNTVKRPLLNLTKTDMSGNLLSGATFKLEEVELSGGEWRQIEGSYADVKTTDSNGVLVFDNLIAGKYYRLTETQAPLGYIIGTQPIIIVIDGNGRVQMVSLVNGAVSVSELTAEYISYTSPFNITVTNISIGLLPETGGSGTYVYTLSGALLTAAAAVLMIYRTRRKEDDPPYV